MHTAFQLYQDSLTIQQAAAEPFSSVRLRWQQSPSPSRICSWRTPSGSAQLTLSCATVSSGLSGTFYQKRPSAVTALGPFNMAGRLRPPGSFAQRPEPTTSHIQCRQMSAAQQQLGRRSAAPHAALHSRQWRSGSKVAGLPPAVSRQHIRQPCSHSSTLRLQLSAIAATGPGGDDSSRGSGGGRKLVKRSSSKPQPDDTIDIAGGVFCRELHAALACAAGTTPLEQYC